MSQTCVPSLSRSCSVVAGLSTHCLQHATSLLLKATLMSVFFLMRKYIVYYYCKIGGLFEIESVFQQLDRGVFPFDCHHIFKMSHFVPELHGVNPFIFDCPPRTFYLLCIYMV